MDGTPRGFVDDGADGVQPEVVGRPLQEDLGGLTTTDAIWRQEETPHDLAGAGVDPVHFALTTGRHHHLPDAEQVGLGTSALTDSCARTVGSHFGSWSNFDRVFSAESSL